MAFSYCFGAGQGDGSSFLIELLVDIARPLAGDALSRPETDKGSPGESRKRIEGKIVLNTPTVPFRGPNCEPTGVEVRRPGLCGNGRLGARHRRNRRKTRAMPQMKGDRRLRRR